VFSTLALSFGVSHILFSTTFSGIFLVKTSLHFAISIAVHKGLVGAIADLAAILNHLFCILSIHDTSLSYHTFNHKSAAHHAVLEMSHAVSASLVNHHNLAHLLTNQAHHCITVKVSLAAPIGSSVIVL